MADLTTIKNWFKTGLKPTQTQFWAWMDSFWHKDEQIPQSAVQNLIATLNAKAEASQLNGHKTDPNAHSDLFALKEDKTQKGVPNGYVPLNEFGKILSDYLVIIDDLITGGSASILSAEQGKELKTQIDAINLILTSDDVNLDTVQELVTAIKEVEASLGTILVNDLTTGGVTKALTAEMGKTLKGLVDALAIKPTSVQNGAGVEQFTTLDVFKFSNVSFNPTTKTIEVNPLVPLSAFLDPINGSDTAGVVENSNKPFKTINALLNALPTTTGETYNIYITGGTISVTRRISIRNLRFTAYADCTLNFTNCMEDDGVTHASNVLIWVNNTQRFWNFENNNISIICDYIGTKNLDVLNDKVPVFTGNLNVFNWKSKSGTGRPSLFLNAGSDLKINSLYDSSQNQPRVVSSNGGTNLNINTFFTQSGYKIESNNANTYVSNIVKVGSATFNMLWQSLGNLSYLELGNITLPGCTFKPATYRTVFKGNVSDTTLIDFVNIKFVSGILNSALYPINININNDQVFTNYIGKANALRIENGSLSFENSIITCDTHLVEKINNYQKQPVLFSGSNTIIQSNLSGDLFRPASSLTTGNLNIEIEDRGTLKTNAKTLGFNAVYNITATTFKEKLNEIVIRSKKDIVNKVLSSSTNYIIDGIIDDIVATDRIIVPVGGLSMSGYGFDVSALKATQNNSVLFESPVGGCGNLFLSNISLEASGVGSKVFNLTNAGAPTGGADAIELNVVNFDNCTSLGELTNFRQGLWDNIGVFGCKDGLTLSGTWSGGFRSDLVIVRNFGVASVVSTLFKKGTALVFQSRFLTDINADFKAGGLLSNFEASNFLSNKLYQIKGAILTRGKVIDSTDNYTDTLNVNSTVCDWFGNIGLPNAGQVAYTDIEVNDPSKGLVLTSPDGTKFRMTVSDLGVTTITAV